VRGGVRKNAGRPVNSGKYGMPTTCLRVPIVLVPAIKEFIKNQLTKKRDQSDEDQTN